jgi:hypothetical protein
MDVETGKREPGPDHDGKIPNFLSGPISVPGRGIQSSGYQKYSRGCMPRPGLMSNPVENLKPASGNYKKSGIFVKK